jgi:hypothetical protein
MQEVTSIGSITISAGWDKGRPILILNNNGQRGEFIDCRYLELGKSSSKTWKILYLPYGKQEQEQLPDNFRKWEKFGFHINGERLLAPVSELEKVLKAAKKQVIIEPSQPETESAITEPEQPEEVYELADKVIKPNIETTHILEQPTIDFQQEAETIIQQTNGRITELVRAYKDGEAIDFENIANPTPSQNVLLILNWIGRTIREWINEFKQDSGAEHDLVDTLIYSEQHIQEKLRAIRGELTPVFQELELETEINTDAELDKVRNKCALHVAWFEGRLFGYEERVEIKIIKEYDQFIPQFIKDRLFNGIARVAPFDQLPAHLEELLELVGYEVVPIEIGKTQADARVHDIQGSRQTNGEPGTIVEVILPGLRRKENGAIIQKPVVIRGE